MAIAAPFPAARAPRPVSSTAAARRSPRPGARRSTAYRSAAHRSTASRQASGGLVLTRRGRVVLGVLSTVFLLAVVMLSGRFSADAGTSIADQGRATGVVVVQPGESLWQIARVVAPQADPRETVTLIRDLNGLGDTTVVAGQSIVVPVTGAPGA